LPGFRSLLLILAVAAAVAGDIIALIMHRVPWPYEPIWRTLPLSLSLVGVLCVVLLFKDAEKDHLSFIFIVLGMWPISLMRSFLRWVPRSYGLWPPSDFPRAPPLPPSDFLMLLSRLSSWTWVSPYARCSMLVDFLILSLIL
jgi:hypothetical protein